MTRQSCPRANIPSPGIWHKCRDITSRSISRRCKLLIHGTIAPMNAAETVHHVFPDRCRRECYFPWAYRVCNTIISVADRRIIFIGAIFRRLSRRVPADYGRHRRTGLSGSRKLGQEATNRSSSTNRPTIKRAHQNVFQSPICVFTSPWNFFFN